MPSFNPASVNRLSLIFENEAYLAVNKSAGMLTIPDRFDARQPNLLHILQERYPRIWVVHRLDRETSGLVLFAKNEASHSYLSGLFENREIRKIYQGVVLGSLAEKKGLIEVPIAAHPLKKGMMVTSRSGKPAITEYEVLKDYGIYSLVEFRIHTGKTHQIRVHMKSMGHPLVCDPLYGDGKPVLLSSFKKKFRLSQQEETERPLFERVALHSYHLDFTDPSGEAASLTAPLPKDFRALLHQLDKNRGDS